MESINLQRGIIAAILNDSNCLEDSSRLKEDDFTVTKYKEIFKASQKLMTEETEVNIMTIYTELNGAITVSELSEVAADLYYPASFEKHMKDLQDFSLKRKLKEIASEIVSSEKKGHELADEIEQQVFELRDTEDAGEFTEASSLAFETYKRIEDIQGGKIDRGISTGFNALDRALGGGMRKGEYIVLGARPSMGKTALALNIAENVTRAGKSAAIFSLEMTKEQLMERMISSFGHVNLQKELNEDGWKRVIDSTTDLSSRKLFINDNPRLEIGDMFSMCRKLKRQEGLDLVVIDYLQKIPCSKGKNRMEEINYISNAVKNMAKLLNVPVVVISSLSRSVENREDKRPIMSDLRESGQIEFDADVIMFLYRDEYYNPESDRGSIGEVILSKNRNGGIGVVELIWKSEFTSFKNMEWRQ